MEVAFEAYEEFVQRRVESTLKATGKKVVTKLIPIYGTGTTAIDAFKIVVCICDECN